MSDRWEDETQEKITLLLKELVEERDIGRNRIYEKYGSAGLYLLEPLIALAEAVRIDRPDELLAFLLEFKG